jgi:hypothetical protein
MNKIAIYNGFQFHYEVLGYLIEYFLYKNINFDLYSTYNNSSSNWKQFYDRIFNKNIQWLIPNSFNSDNYNIVIIATGDDLSCICNNKIKIIRIEHGIDYQLQYAHFRITTRYINNNYRWALPIFNGLSKNDKKNILDKQKKINVLILGRNNPSSIKQLKDIFFNFKNLNLFIVSRSFGIEFEKESNTFIYANCPTNLMLILLELSHYVLCLDNSELYNSDCYAQYKISGSIPLSFSFGARLILPKKWQDFYKFESVLTYDNGLNLDKDTNLDIIYSEKNNLINHRNNTFDNVLNN